MSSGSCLCGVMGCVVWIFCSSITLGRTYFSVQAVKKILFEGGLHATASALLIPLALRGTSRPQIRFQCA